MFIVVYCGPKTAKIFYFIMKLDAHFDSMPLFYFSTFSTDDISLFMLEVLILVPLLIFMCT